MVPLLASSLLLFDFHVSNIEKHCQSEVDKLSYELTHYDMRPSERQYLIGKMSAYDDIIFMCQEIKEED